MVVRVHQLQALLVTHDGAQDLLVVAWNDLLLVPRTANEVDYYSTSQWGRLHFGQCHCPGEREPPDQIQLPLPAHFKITRLSNDYLLPVERLHLGPGGEAGLYETAVVREPRPDHLTLHTNLIF